MTCIYILQLLLKYKREILTVLPRFHMEALSIVSLMAFNSTYESRWLYPIILAGAKYWLHILELIVITYWEKIQWSWSKCYLRNFSTSASLFTWVMTITMMVTKPLKRKIILHFIGWLEIILHYLAVTVTKLIIIGVVVAFQLLIVDWQV